jgi:hypothetical protein
LEGVTFDERFLQGMQLFRRKAFDRYDLGPLVHHREREARIDPPAIHQHRARATLAVIASFFGAGEVEVLTQRVKQTHPRTHVHSSLCPVEDKGNGTFCRYS